MVQGEGTEAVRKTAEGDEPDEVEDFAEEGVSDPEEWADLDDLM